MKTRKRGGGKGDAKPPEKKHVKKNPVSKPPISEPPIKSILRTESRFANRNYSPLNKEKIVFDSKTKLIERVEGMNHEVRRLEAPITYPPPPRPPPPKNEEEAAERMRRDEENKIEHNKELTNPYTGIVVTKMVNGELVPKYEYDKKLSEEASNKYVKILNEFEYEDVLDEIIGKLEKKGINNITKQDLLAVAKRDCANEHLARTGRIAAMFTEKDRKTIMETIKGEEKNAPSWCNIMGGKRKTRTRRKTRRKKTKRRRNLS